MSRFYVDPSAVGPESIRLEGPAVSHIRQVLRMRSGDDLTLCDGAGTDYDCRILSFEGNACIAQILERRQTTQELPVRSTLYQGLPKKDKMELIVQKAVELGACEIVPVMGRRSIAKLEDPKKESKKLERWNAIAQGAAEQSGRGILPKVRPVLSFSEAIREMAALDMGILPYEKASGMLKSRELIKRAAAGQTAGVLIGPEGGFDPEEVRQACEAGIHTISLGKRILRTETAGMSVLSLLMTEAECLEEERNTRGSIS